MSQKSPNFFIDPPKKKQIYIHFIVFYSLIHQDPQSVNLSPFVIVSGRVIHGFFNHLFSPRNWWGTSIRNYLWMGSLGCVTGFSEEFYGRMSRDGR